MTSFEFVFSLLSILLGLGLAEVLGGLARVIKRRPRARIGWPTGLLAAFTMTETILFWRVAWRARLNMPDTSTALFTGFLITALYYFAGALVLPDEMEGRETLDEHFANEKTKVLGALLIANAIAYAVRPLIMGAASWSYMAWFDWVSLTVIYIAGLTAMVTKRRPLVIACLTVLVAVDLLDPIESLLWPN
jgi:hypothetical protein